MQVYCIKAALMHNKRIYRNIEILENQTLADLHESIFEAFDRYDEHLYSFFVTRKATRSANVIYEYPEITHPMNLMDHFGLGLKKRYDAEKTKTGDLGLDEKEKLYYLFDFGDDWWHELTILKIKGARSSKGYPRIIKKVGVSPEQYPDYDDDYDEEDDI